jgi:hypothetical protein
MRVSIIDNMLAIFDNNRAKINKYLLYLAQGRQCSPGSLLRHILISRFKAELEYCYQ